MTWAQMKVDKAETERRQGIVVKMNLIWDKMNRAPDEKTRRRYSRQHAAIRKQEAAWMKDAAYFLY